MVNLESVCDKVEKDNELGIWDENQDYGKILYFSSSRILVKKMGKRWSHRKVVVLLEKKCQRQLFLEVLPVIS